MKKYIEKFFCLTIIFITILCIYSNSYAVNQKADDGGGSSTSTDDVTMTNESGTKYEEKLDEITSSVRKIAIGFIGLAAVATGIIYMTGTINANNRGWGKTALIGLILGTFVLALAGDIGKLVMGALYVKSSDLKVVQRRHGDLSKKAKAVSFMVDGTPGERPSFTGEFKALKEKLLAIRNEIVARRDENYAKSTCMSIQIPVWTIQNGQKVSSKKWLTLNKEIASQVSTIFTEIYNSPEKFPIKDVGAWSWRNGKLTLPNHPSGMAIDINYDENFMIRKNGDIEAGSFWKPGDNVYSMPPNGSVVQTFKKYGWDWGGDWSSSKDYMHFSILGG